MSKAKEISGDPGTYQIFCPGCKTTHEINTQRKNLSGAQWSLSGDLNSPSFSPSINIRSGNYVAGYEQEVFEDHSSICHFFITNGMIQYCGDSTHEFSGKTITLPEIN
jgi:hypothetical protein